MIKSAVKKGQFVKCDIESMKGRVYQIVDFDECLYLVEVDKIAEGVESLTPRDFWRVSAKYFAANFSLVEDERTEKPTRAAGVVAAALVLLSLTIGAGNKPAHIYTTDPAAVLASVSEAGETVTAYAITEL